MCTGPHNLTRGGGLGSSTIFKNLMSPTPRRKWYLTTGRRAHSMVLDPIPPSLPVHFFGSRPQPPTSLPQWSPAFERSPYTQPPALSSRHTLSLSLSLSVSLSLLFACVFCVCTCACMCIYCVWLSVCLCVWILVCWCVCMFEKFAHICMHMYIYTYIHAYIHACIFTYMHTHTYKHT